MSRSDDDSEIEASRAPLLEHLTELRNRLIICVAALFVAFGVCFAVSEPILQWLLHPYKVAAGLVQMQEATGKAHSMFNPDLFLGLTGFKDIPAPEGKLQMISTGALEVLWVKFKIAALGAIALTFPLLAGQLYGFVAPGLYKRERRAFLPFLFASPVLFVLGGALVYYVMLPFLMWFSLGQQITDAPVTLELLPKISDYAALVTGLLLAFGLCFQLPVVVTLLGLASIVSSKALSAARRYAIVGVFIIAAVVTPPDPISQITLALPLILLYEISIWCVKIIELRRKREDEASAGKDLTVVSG